MINCPNLRGRRFLDRAHWVGVPAAKCQVRASAGAIRPRGARRHHRPLPLSRLWHGGDCQGLSCETAARRGEARYPAQEPAELEILFGDGTPIYGTILDVSRSGLRIALPRRISRGEQVKVKLNRNVIFGEVRYCRAVSAAFQAGIRIQDLVRPVSGESQHLTEDALSLYAVGKGLSVSEVIDVREHLVQCESCRVRVSEREALLNPSRRTRSNRPPCSEPRASSTFEDD